MLLFYISIVLIFILFIYLYIKDFKIEMNLHNSLLLLIIIGFSIRILAGLIISGEPNIISNYLLYLDILNDEGLANFYYSNHNINAPPVYLFILNIINHIINKLNIINPSIIILLLKMPGIIFDLLLGSFIFLKSKNRMRTDIAWILGLFYILNPAIIFNTSIVLDMNSIFMFFIVLFFYYASKKEIFISCQLFIIALFLDLKILIFLPVLLFNFYDYFKTKGFNKYSLNNLKDTIIVSILVFLIITLPYSRNFDIYTILSDYFTVNMDLIQDTGFNLYTFVNFLPMNIKYVFAGILFIFSIILLNRNSSRSNYFFTGGLIYLCFYILNNSFNISLLPSIGLFLFAYIFNRNRHLLFVYFTISLTALLEVVTIFWKNVFGINNDNLMQIQIILSVFNILLALFIIYIGFKIYKKEENQYDYQEYINMD